jgi:hypothetical protein
MRISRTGALLLSHIFSPNHHSKTTIAKAFRFALWFRAEAGKTVKVYHGS